MHGLHSMTVTHLDVSSLPGARPRVHVLLEQRVRSPVTPTQRLHRGVEVVLGGALERVDGHDHRLVDLARLRTQRQRLGARLEETDVVRVKDERGSPTREPRSC